MKVSQNTRRTRFFLRFYPRARARATDSRSLPRRTRSLSRLIDPSYRFLQWSRTRALTPWPIPARFLRGLNPGRGCFAPVSLDRPICTASLFRSGKLGDWRLRSLVGSIDRSIDRFALRARQNRSSSRSAHLVTLSFRRRGTVALINKNKLTKREKTWMDERRKNPPPSVLGKNERLSSRSNEVNSCFYAPLEENIPVLAPIPIHRTYGGNESFFERRPTSKLDRRDAEVGKACGTNRFRSDPWRSLIMHDVYNVVRWLIGGRQHAKGKAVSNF